MSITDELREWIDSIMWLDESISQAHKDVLAIADRIDEQYDRTCRALDSAWSATAHEVLEQAIDELSDEYVKLPVDADGEIWTGNERVFEVGNGTRYDMRYLMYDGEKWIIDSSFGGFIANECRHYHAPTVEDVLREFTDRVLEWAGKSGSVAEIGTWSDVAAEYAAKLRLAGDAE